MNLGEQQRAELRKLANELRVEAYILTEDDNCILEALQAAYSLGWDTMKEQAAQVSDKFRGQLSREEWPPFGLCQEEGRFDSGVSGLTATRIAEAIRAIPREEKP